MPTKDGKPFLAISQLVQPYQTTEEIKDSKGKKIGARNVTISPPAINMDTFDLGAHGWHRSKTYRVVEEKEVFRPILHTDSFERSKGLVLKTFTLDVGNYACSHCGQTQYSYVKLMPTGAFLRCFKCDLSMWFPECKSTAKYYALESEKAISPEKARELIKSETAWCHDNRLRKLLGLESM